MPQIPHSMQHPTIRLAHAALEREALSVEELAGRLGMSFGAVSRAVRWLHAQGKVRIVSWRRVAGPPIRVFAAGAGPDAPRIQKRTYQENNKIAWQRQLRRARRRRAWHRTRRTRR